MYKNDIKNVIIEASAGSGKTYRLAKRYIEILSHIFKKREDDCLIQASGIGSVVAITFTNKAAAEMKERILKFLRILSGFEKGKVEGVELSDKDSLDMLMGIIGDYSDFNIMTIDSFMNRIMRAFSVDLGISPDYEITFDRDQILDLAFRDLIENGDIKGDLLDFLRIRLVLGDKGMDGLKIIKKALTSFDISSFEFSGCSKIKKEDLLRYCKNECNIDIVGDFYDIKRSIEKRINYYWGLFKKIVEKEYEAFNKNTGRFLFGEEISGEYLDRLEYICNIGVDRFLKKGATISEDNLSKMKDISCKISKLIKFYNIYYAFEDARSILKVSSYFFESKERVEKQLNVVRGDRLAKSILDVLKSKNGVTYAFIQLGERLYHYLIDEFQDTSKEQFEAVYPLIENVISSCGSLFVVGDRKQAIYGWRGGDYRIFDELEKRSMSHEIKREILDCNYRSVSNIVEFNNKVFAPENIISSDIVDIFDDDFSDMLKNEILNIYKNVRQKKAINKQGFIEVILRQTEDREEFYKNEFLRIFDSLLEQGLEPRDIMVLLRRKSDIEKVASWISQNYPEIDILTEDSLILTKNPKIKQLLLVASAIVFKDDKSYENAAIELVDNLDRKKLNEFKEIFKAKSLYEVVLGLLSEFEFKSTDLYVATLLEEILKRSRAFKMDNEILKDIYNDPVVVSLTEGVNALRILTIHKAKGLQSQTVIVPFYDWVVYDSKKNVFDFVSLKDIGIDNKCMFANVSALKDVLPEARKIVMSKIVMDFVEALNLMYVANTRAEDNLFIIGAYKLTSRGKFPKNVTSAHLLKNAMDRTFDKKCLSECVYRNGNLIKRKTAKYKEGIDDINIKSSLGWRIRDRLNISPSFFESSDEILLGDLFHASMSFIKAINDRDNVDLIIESAYKNAVNLVGYRNEKVKDMIKKTINDLSDLFFGVGEVYNEKEFVDKDGRVLRPDRIIVFRDNEKNIKRIVVVEYKTGKNEKEHEDQLMSYTALFDSAEGVLYYCSNGERYEFKG